MGIARRKAGTVVRCPKCSGQVVVPATSDTGSLTPQPGSTDSPHAAAPSSPFEFGAVDVQVLPPSSADTTPEAIDVVPLGGAAPVSGVFLTIRHLLAAGVLIVVMLVSSFFLGWFLRGR